MRKSFKRFLKKSIPIFMVGLLLAGLIPPNAADAQEDQVGPSRELDKIIKQVSSLELFSETSESTLTWNILNKIDRGIPTFFYQSKKPTVKLSANGRYVVANRYHTPTNDPLDTREIISVIDRLTGEVIDIEIPSASIYDSILDFDIDDSATYIVFYLSTFNEGEAFPTSTIYLYDRVNENLEHITSTPGETSYDDHANKVTISADGRYIAFDSKAKGLVPEDDDDNRDIFLYDREATENKIKRISTRPGLEIDDINESSSPSISADGRIIAFQSTSNLIDEDDNYVQDIYVFDRDNAVTPLKRISVGHNGVDVDHDSYQPSISADGQTVAFISDATNLVENDTNYQADLFVFDGTLVKRVAVIPEASEPEDLDRWKIDRPSISPDGKYVGYEWHEATEEDDLVEIYVADIETKTSSLVNVPNTPYKLVNSSHLPVIDSLAKSVLFYSTYERTIDGHGTFELPGLFIATQGSMPVWSPGSTLQATVENERITLSWPDATDISEIAGYQVIKDEVVIGYVPFSEDNSFTTDIEAGVQHSFQVEAVNINYNVSVRGPVYQMGTTTPPDNPLIVSWEVDRSRNGLPSIGSNLKINAFKSTGMEGLAVVSYKLENTLGEVESRTEEVILRENNNQSSYSGIYSVKPGTVEITSINVRLTDPLTKEVSEKAINGFPTQISGNATVSFNNSGKVDLAGAFLSVRSNRYGSEFIVLNGEEPVTLEGLYPNEEYTVTIFSSEHMKILSQVDGIQATSGKTTDVSMNIEASSTVRFQFENSKGDPVPYVGVQFFDSNQEYLGSYTSREDGFTDYLGGLKSGESIKAKVDLGDYMYQSVPDQVVELIAGENIKVIKLIDIPIGKLEGIVTNPENKPVMNALVTAEQMIDGKKIVKQTHSNLDGSYKFDDMFEGQVTIEASETSYHYSTENIVEAEIKTGKTTTVPITVKQPKTGIINLKVFLKYIDSEWIGPVNMEQMNFHVKIHSKHGWQSGYYQNAYNYAGYPGDEVNVCVTSTTPSYTTECKLVTLDEHANGTAEIRFAEVGGRIQGTLAQTDHLHVSGSLYKIQGTSRGWAKSIGSSEFRGDNFNINIKEAGNYSLELTRRLSNGRYEYATVDFTVKDQQITNIGAIDFSPTSYFANKYGNVFSALPNMVVPGGKVTFRASYRNVKDKVATDTSLILSIPEGMSPVKNNEGQIIVNGIQSVVSLDGQNMIVPLGELAPNQSGTISYQLIADATLNSNSNITTSARIKTVIDSLEVEETIGTILLDAPKVTIEVPKTISNLQTEISGYAPAGSPVKIYDGKVLVGSTDASPTGFWRKTVSLPNLGNPSIHEIYAVTSENTVELRSKSVYTEYNTVSPRLLEVAMAQAPDKKWVTLDVDKGISRLPYTVVPGNPFQFDLKFDRPDDVENVYLYLDGQSGGAVKAVRDGNLYRVVTPTGLDALGGIYVSFDEKAKPFVPDEHQPTLEEIRQSLPPLMRDFEVVSTTPFEFKNGKFSGQVKLKLPQMDNTLMTVTLTIEPNVSYKPTAEEIELVESSGLPMFNSSIGETENEESFTTVLQGYLSMDVIFPDGMPNNINAQGLFTSLSGGQSGYQAMAHFSTEVTLEFGDQIKSGNDVRKAFNDYKDYSSKINKIMYNVERGMDCVAEMPTTAKKAGVALVAVVGGEIAKVALGAWTGAMSLTGPAGAAAAVATQVAEGKIDDYVDSKIDAIGTGFNECNEEDEKRKRRKIADPKWIYDPSGYVYEAIPENRLEGVSATVLYLDSATNEWTVWDAGPYEQINPHSTNNEGKYGWDVPPGKWKVVWQKEGYETQTSAELDVPPPHTDVNAGLISRTAPQVEKVKGVLTENGSYVEVTFTKYLNVVNLPTNAIIITDTHGKNLVGQSTFVSTATDPNDVNGTLLSRTVRFETTSKFVATNDYQIKLNSSYLKSYADVRMKEDYTGSFTVVEEDIFGPTLVEAQASGMLLAVRFNEPIGSVNDLNKFLVNGIRGSIISAVTDVDDNRLLYLTLNKQLVESEPVNITALAGAVTDITGNMSLEGNLLASIDSDSSNALLKGLTVSFGTLSPQFDPNHLSYTVSIRESEKYLMLTATSADTNAKIYVDGIEMASGIGKTVFIPENGEINITVIAEDGSTSQTYTIKVNHSQDNPPTVPGPVITPPVGDILDLGKHATIEKKKDSDGRITLLVSLQKEAVVNALKSKDVTSKPVFVNVKEQADEYVLQLSREILELLKKKDATLQFKTNIINATMNTAAFDVSSLSDDSVVQIILGNILEKENILLFEQATQQSRGSLKPNGKVINIGIEASSKVNETFPIDLKNSKALLIEWPNELVNNAAFYQYKSSSSNWSFVSDTRTISIASSGLYTVMTYKNTFDDVFNHWAKSEIEWMAQRLLVKGYNEDEFKPEQAITRGEFTLILARALGLELKKVKKEPTFADVSKDSVFYEAVEAAAAAGIVKGKNKTTFAPNEEITREQMTVMITRAYIKLVLEDSATGDVVFLEKFKDRKLFGDWAANYVALALQVGLVRGKSETKFDPRGLATRAQAVVMIFRLLQKQDSSQYRIEK